ncbi:52 kDa repressor of the inhibitor of the protein kinase-like isoform X2 [Latimeria chalumnae]|nr:PREDICTED: 52 kDa repressor of the inhibitor of the protein kinase-like isoform X2 [Latimeria chalumnae]XP_014352111.1 PREDICTED: 52 kDa repressor of the inhibitor of the protein kinase-like isoform X2 [Latimeria chalumnae]|eukprot:XP_014352110.1 PREDICTED: 52 kDa repressor of the inhibitor of the protein kinase-like isoform X2 [Latimeria chalumnae]
MTIEKLKQEEVEVEMGAEVIPLTEAVCKRVATSTNKETGNTTVKSDQLEMETTFEEIKVYFARDEWETLHDWEKEVYKSMKEHYDVVISFGHEIPKPDFMCIPKDNKPASTYLKRHHRIYKGEKPYSCTQCRKNFRYLLTLKSHQQIHRREKPYNCAECGKSFIRLSSFYKHKRFHKAKNSDECRSAGKHSCSSGCRTTQKRVRIRKKQAKNTEHVRSVNSSTNLLTCKEGKPYECPECGKCFRQSSHLNTHKKIHKGDQLYICTDCGKSFNQSKGCIKHQRLHKGSCAISAAEDAISRLARAASQEAIPPVYVYDIERYAGNKQLTDETKYEVLKNVWIPPVNYKFPKKVENGKNRSFNASWLKQFQWLAYSPKHDGAFCVYCVLFAKAAGKIYHKLDKLYRTPLTYWTSACYKMKEHDLSPTHKAAVITGKAFREAMEQGQHHISAQQDITNGRHMMGNREKLTSILKSIIFCGKQILPLCGNEVDPTNTANINPGNFQALLDFRVDSGDTVLQEHFRYAPRNATYRSKTIQTELIECIAEFIQSNRVEDVDKFFSIIVDEAQHSCNMQQLPLFVRFCDPWGGVREEFLAFLSFDMGVTGEAIADTIKNIIGSVGLDMSYCRGQCYDGAGNLMAACKEAAACILAEYPKAVYTNSASHELNLVIAKCSTNQIIHHMATIVTEASLFFNQSPKIQFALEKNIQDICSHPTQVKLFHMCKRRWILCMDSFEVFLELLEPVVITLEDIKDNVGKRWNSTVTAKANSLYHSVTQFEFIMAIVLTVECPARIRAAIVKFQSSVLDILEGYRELEISKGCLEHMRNQVESKHGEWFAKAVKLAGKLSVVVNKPRSLRHLRQGESVHAETPEAYYKNVLTLPFVDHFLSEINFRFFRGQWCIFKGLTVVPSVLKMVGEKWKLSFKELCQTYIDDLPCPQSLDVELTMWELYWVRKISVPDSLNKLLPMVDRVTFPNIWIALCILAAVSITPCETELCLAAMKRLKAYMSSSKGQYCQNGLSLLHVHYTLDIDQEKVLDIFIKKYPQRMQLVNILLTD